MLLDYGTQMSPSPILLSIGRIKKPKLSDISELTFDMFNVYECFLKMTPEDFYTNYEKEFASENWDVLTDDEKKQVTLYDLVLKHEKLRNIYVEIFNFFFIETVVFQAGFFILYDEIQQDETASQKICGVINENTFLEVLCILQQICCIYDKEEQVEELSFKNKTAQKIYEKMLKAKKVEKKQNKGNNDYSIPNIISSVSCRHPSINYLNVWDLTLFQLFDNFNKLRVDDVYEMNKLRVAVWGDEKKTFDASLWYKNQYNV